MSSLSEHVSLTITEDAVGIADASFGTTLILSANAPWPDRYRSYGALADFGVDFAVGTPEYLAAESLFSQTPHPDTIAVGRAANKPTQKYTIGVQQVLANHAYTIQVDGPGVTSTLCSYLSGPVAPFVATLVFGTGIWTATAHGMSTGNVVHVTAGTTEPAPLVADTDYYVIKVDANTFKLAASLALANAGTAITLTSGGTGTLTIETFSNNTIISQLAAQLNAVVGNNYLATVVVGGGETDTITVIADVAGGWFSLGVVPSDLSIFQSHTDPGVAADLAAIQVVSDDWYALVTLYNSDAYVSAAAAWIQAQSKMYFPDVNDTRAVNTTGGAGGSADILDALHSSAYSRTSGIYHWRPSDMLAAGWLGSRLPYLPGSDDWKYAQVEGPIPNNLTSTQRANLRARKANTLQTVVAGATFMWEGTVASGDFIDNTRGFDWLQDDMSKAVLGALLNAKKVPYTNAGIALIENEVRGSLARAVSNGILTNDPAPVVTVPKVSDVSTAQRALRILPDIKFSANLAGAVHQVVISGVISV